MEYFSSVEDLCKRVNTLNIKREPTLTLFFTGIAESNIGHALFDGLYPAYVGLHRLGMQDQEFRPVVGVPKNCFEAEGPTYEGKLKAGELVSAYLPHPLYNKSLEPVMVELLEVKEQTSSNVSEGESLCSFEQGFRSSAFATILIFFCGFD